MRRSRRMRQGTAQHAGCLLYLSTLPTCLPVSLRSIVLCVEHHVKIRDGLLTSHVPSIAPVRQPAGGPPQLAVPAPEPAAGSRQVACSVQAGAAACPRVRRGAAAAPYLYCTVALPSSEGKGGKGASAAPVFTAAGGLGTGDGLGDREGGGGAAGAFLHGPLMQFFTPQYRRVMPHRPCSYLGVGEVSEVCRTTEAPQNERCETTRTYLLQQCFGFKHGLPPALGPHTASIGAQ